MSICNNTSFYSYSITSDWTKEESQISDSRAKDPCRIIPCNIVVDYIFSYLNLHELGVSRRVSRLWNQYASDPTLWRSKIYLEIAFSSKNWAQWDPDLVKDVDVKQEILSLPDNIAEELRCSAFRGKNIRETHVLVRMPKGLTINKLAELSKKYFPINIYGYRFIPSSIVDALGDEPADKSVWLLMTQDILPGSSENSFSVKQRNFVAELAETTGIPYQLPTALEAATCILAEYSRSGNRLFSEIGKCFRRNVYTYCQDQIQGLELEGTTQVVVGGFLKSGFVICYHNYCGVTGFAALRKF